MTALHVFNPPLLLNRKTADNRLLIGADSAPQN